MIERRNLGGVQRGIMTVKIPLELLTWVRQQSKQTGMSINLLATLALQGYRDSPEAEEDRQARRAGM